jgi:hypothetical protein
MKFSGTGDTGVSGSGTSARHGPRRTGRCRDGHENPADCSGDRTDRPADHCSHRTGVSVDVDDEAEDKGRQKIINLAGHGMHGATLHATGVKEFEADRSNSNHL